ncbi:hypothetical protein [Streptomyces sp. NBC_01506]|uniref:hypothetical protein n=1 Tax=Streptomyces sp. NBC_01506 TaxID=2903887 RepID=UPI003862DFB9
MPQTRRHARLTRLLRITSLLQAAAILAQSVTAGLLLASVPVGRTSHSMLGGAVALTVVLNLFVAVLLWRPGGGSPRLAVKSAPLVVFTVVQMALGFARVRELHVPLGVLMFGASIMLVMETRAEVPRPARGGEPA